MAALSDGGEAYSQQQQLGHVSINEHINRLTVLARAVFLSKSTSTPPGSPATLDAYLMPSSPTGDWAGQNEGSIAFYDGGGWLFIDNADVPVGYVFSDLSTGTNGTVYVKDAATPTYTSVQAF